MIQPQQAWQATLSIAAGATKFILVKEATVYSRFDVVKLERHHLYRTKNCIQGCLLDWLTHIGLAGGSAAAAAAAGSDD